MNPNASVIVPSYNGRKKLPSILKALESQTIRGFEVIVVLDGSTDGSEDFLKTYQAENFKLRVVERENGGRAKVRNSGAEQASSDLLIFYDDDMRPEPNSIAFHIAFHETHKGAICGGNQVEDENLARTDFDRYRCFLRKRWLEPYPELMSLDTSNVYLTAANFSIPKEVFDRLNGFNSSMRDHEDRDLAVRALVAGIDVYFDPSNIGWHDDFVSVRAYIARRRQYQKEFDRMGASASIPFTKRVVYGLFSNRYWVNAIANETLTFLPRKIRFRLYDLIIWGLGSYFIERSVSK